MKNYYFSADIAELKRGLDSQNSTNISLAVVAYFCSAAASQSSNAVGFWLRLKDNVSL